MEHSTPAEGPSGVECIDTVAPEDVRRMVSSLLGDGWTIERARGGHGQAFGDIEVVVAKAGERVTVVRDRGQWAVGVQLPHWHSSFDLGTVMDAMSNREEWG